MERNIIYPFAEPKKSKVNEYVWDDMTSPTDEIGTLDFIPFMGFSDTNTGSSEKLTQYLNEIGVLIEESKEKGERDGNLMKTAEDYSGPYNYDRRDERIKTLKRNITMQDKLWEAFGGHGWLQSEEYHDAATPAVMKKLSHEGDRIRAELESLETLHKYEKEGI